MLQPKRTKFRKLQKGVVIKKQKRASTYLPPQGNNHKLAFGAFGIKSLTSGHLCSSTIETLRRALSRKFKRTGKIWIRIFPHLSVTKKPAEVRMGKGKGSPAFWLAKVPAGQILFEISGVSEDLMKQAVKLISGKVSLKLLLIKN